MKISSIRSTLTPSKLKDFMSLDGGRSYRELLKSHSVTMDVSELTLMEFILICERNDMIIHPSINTNPGILSFDSYRMNNVSERNERTARDYIKKCNDLYMNLVEKYDVPPIEAISVLPLSLYISAKITVTGYGLSKSLFKYTDIHGIFTDGPAARAYGLTGANKTIENLTEIMMNKYLATLNSVESRKDHCIKMQDMNNFDTCSPSGYTYTDLYHLNWQSKEDMSMSTYVSILMAEISSISAHKGLDMRRDKSMELTFNRRYLADSIKNNPDRKCERETIRKINELRSMRTKIKNKALLSDLTLGVETVRIYISGNLMDEIVTIANFIGEGCGNYQTYEIFINRYKKLEDNVTPALKSMINEYLLPAVM